MPCYHPLKAWKIGINSNNKSDLKITSYKVDHIEKWKDGLWHSVDEKFQTSLSIAIQREFTPIPCGQCLGCRIDYSREWANRMMLELQYHKSAYFVTLTYDDRYVPLHYYSDEETGEAFPSMSLEKRDVQLFLKRLRRQTGQQLRFFAAGEYGSSSLRPHYHLIIFGLELDDLVFYKRSSQGFTYYNSATVQKAWSNLDSYGDRIPIGYAVVAPVSWETCAYTARYVTKKLTGEAKDYYERFNIEPEFSLMSRKPGLAYQYFKDHPDIYEHEYINISTEKGGRKFRPPKYYDNLYDLEEPEKMAEIKSARQKMAAEIQRLKLQKTDLSYLELLAVEEAAFKARISSLERRLE